MSVHPASNANVWSEDEDRRLLSAAEVAMPFRAFVSEFLPGRSEAAANQRLLRLRCGRDPRTDISDMAISAADRLEREAARDGSKRLLRAMLVYGLRYGPERTPAPGLLGMSMAQVRARAEHMGLR